MRLFQACPAIVVGLIGVFLSDVTKTEIGQSLNFIYHPTFMLKAFGV
jgi:hypothetical protein